MEVVLVGAAWPDWLAVSLRTLPGRGAERAPWDTPPSCAGSGWHGRHQSCAGLSPSSAAWARSELPCACGS